jgi:hypothetical protein
MIASPEDGATVSSGGDRGERLRVVGRRTDRACRGQRGRRVQLDGRDAREATLPHAAVPWSAKLTVEPGSLELLSRATDGAQNVQPDSAPWNALGYGNNSVQRVRILVA